MFVSFISKYIRPLKDFCNIYESKLKEARDIAMEEMKVLAKQKGANAIVGIDVDYEVVRDGMLMVAVSGTAVRV
ncbi:hypothetical protein COL30_20910 [Bacillus pseudomycoides]|nr:hypothetical protein CON79_21850 [Bacillus pseudomycoides]PED07892.1 hypothetical protein COO19_12925 [Bacillus pseudomycoides]PEI82866.1 hypothetical protein CN679_27385 [Bacillus pseudomycoides]PEK06045.1 hypothetical protein CN693_29645 [Bacillus pseudomycoides]PEO04522.1 hypothetical protein CN542_28985 [Bacillus pseudomycoides]